MKKSDNGAIGCLLLAGSLFLLIILNLFWLDHWLDSDMAAEMIFSGELARTGHFIATPDWYYSTEFRFLYTHWLMGPLFHVFGSNWHVIRMLTNLLTYALMLGSYFFFMKPFKARKGLVAGSSVLLLLPFSETMMTHMQMGNTYMFHVIIAFLFMGCFSRITNPEKGKKLPWYVAYAVLGLICGISGVRYLLALQCPLVIASFVWILRSAEFESFRKEVRADNWKVRGKELLSSFTFKYLWASLLGLVCAFAGYLVNVLYVCKAYVFQTYEATNFVSVYQGDFIDRVRDAFGSLLMLFGYIPDKGFLSLRGVISMISFVLIVLFGYVAVRGAKTEKGRRGMMVTFFWSALFLNLFAFLFTTSTMVPRYYLLIYIFLLPLLCFYLEKEEKFFDRFTVLAILILCMAMATGKVAASFVTTDKNYEKKRVAAVLQAENLKFGYATYWNANIITELTDGEVEIANVGDAEHLEFFRWSSPKRYYDQPHDGRVFLLLTDEEYQKAKDAPSVLAGEKVYEDGGYVLLIYDSSQALLQYQN